MRQQAIDFANQTKKAIRKALAQQHPDKGGNIDLFHQIKPLFDQCDSITSQVKSCPDVMLRPLQARLQGLEKQLEAILASQPKTAQKQPKTNGKAKPGSMGQAVNAAQQNFNSQTTAKPKPAPKPKPKSQPKPAPKNQPKPKPKPAAPKPKTDPTKQLYKQLGDITEFLNNTLFGGTLPLPVIRLQVKNNMMGYMTAGKNWKNGNVTTYEMGLNPQYFTSRPLLDLFNTIAHELCHEYCSEVHGSKTNYHDQQWFKEAKSIGLNPTGKKFNVDTQVVPGGKLDQAYQQFMGQNPGFSIDWSVSQATATKKPKSKQKYSCPDCGQNAWAKPGSSLICGKCLVTMALA